MSRADTPAKSESLITSSKANTHEPLQSQASPTPLSAKAQLLAAAKEHTGNHKNRALDNDATTRFEIRNTIKLLVRDKRFGEIAHLTHQLYQKKQPISPEDETLLYALTNSGPEKNKPGTKELLIDYMTNRGAFFSQDTLTPHPNLEPIQLLAANYFYQIAKQTADFLMQLRLIDIHLLKGTTDNVPLLSEDRHIKDVIDLLPIPDAGTRTRLKTLIQELAKQPDTALTPSNKDWFTRQYDTLKKTCIDYLNKAEDLNKGCYHAETKALLQAFAKREFDYLTVQLTSDSHILSVNSIPLIHQLYLKQYLLKTLNPATKVAIDKLLINAVKTAILQTKAAGNFKEIAALCLYLQHPPENLSKNDAAQVSFVKNLLCNTPEISQIFLKWMQKRSEAFQQQYVLIPHDLPNGKGGKRAAISILSGHYYYCVTEVAGSLLHLFNRLFLTSVQKDYDTIPGILKVLKERFRYTDVPALSRADIEILDREVSKLSANPSTSISKPTDPLWQTIERLREKTFEEMDKGILCDDMGCMQAKFPLLEQALMIDDAKDDTFTANYQRAVPIMEEMERIAKCALKHHPCPGHFFYAMTHHFRYSSCRKAIVDRLKANKAQTASADSKSGLFSKPQVSIAEKNEALAPIRAQQVKHAREEIRHAKLAIKHRDPEGPVEKNGFMAFGMTGSYLFAATHPNIEAFLALFEGHLQELCASAEPRIPSMKRQL